MTPRELALSKSPRKEKSVNILDGNIEEFNVKVCKNIKFFLTLVCARLSSNFSLKNLIFC